MSLTLTNSNFKLVHLKKNVSLIVWLSVVFFLLCACQSWGWYSKFLPQPPGTVANVFLEGTLGSSPGICTSQRNRHHAVSTKSPLSEASLMSVLILIDCFSRRRWEIFTRVLGAREVLPILFRSHGKDSTNSFNRLPWRTKCLYRPAWAWRC